MAHILIKDETKGIPIRIILPVFLSVLLFGLTIFLLVLPSFEHYLMESKRGMIKDLVKTTLSDISQFYQMEVQGELTQEQAQSLAIEHIRNLRYGPENKDYFWINDMHPHMVMHPYRTDLEGQDISAFADPNGKHLFVSFVDEVKKHNAGYVDYMWQWKDDPNHIVPKISYVESFEPWNWIVGTGIYVEDVRQGINIITRHLAFLCGIILVILVCLSAYVVNNSLNIEQMRRAAQEELTHHRDHLQELVDARTLELQLAQQSLKDSEQRLKDIISFLPDATLAIDNEGKVIIWNHGMEEMTGISSKDMLGKSDYEYGQPFYGEPHPILIDYIDVDPQTVKSHYLSLKQDGEMLIAEIYLDSFKGGRYLWGVARPLYDAQGKRVGAIESIRDITDRVLAKQELARHRESLAEEIAERTQELTQANEKLKHEIDERRRSEEEISRLATAIAQAAESIFITDPEGTIQYVNPAFEKLTGYSRAEAIGCNPRILKSDKQDASIYTDLWATIKKGQTWHGRLTNRTKANTYYVKEASISPIKDSNGNITNFVSVSRDITREAELEGHIQQMQKMEAIGTLAGGIAHDFNNILSGVIGYTQLAMCDLPETSPACEDMREVMKAANRASELVKQILSFSRRTEHMRKPISIQPIIRETIKLLKGSLPSTIEIQKSIDPNCGVVLADPTQIHQVLLNLCTNAFHAMKLTGGTLSISLSQIHITEKDAEQDPEKKAGDFACITVEDSGTGIPDEILQRMFDPYFTTKEVGEGTGLGLSTVHGIVTNYDGFLTVTSHIGKGSEFKIYLPITTTEEHHDSTMAPESQLPRGTERIIYIDDEQTIVSLGHQILERLGYQVTCYTSSLEALHALTQHPDDYDLIITDLTMPKMTGIQLAMEISKIRPDLPIILCTGFGENIKKYKSEFTNIQDYLMKPIDIPDLADTVHRVLHKQV